MIRKLTLLAFLFIFLSSKAEFVFNDNCKKAYGFIVDFNFEQGKKLVEEEKKRNPQNAVPYLLDNYIDYFQCFVTERQDLFDAWKDNIDKRIDRFQADKPNSPWYLFCQAQTYLQLAFVRFKFREYTGGAYDIHKAYKMLKRNEALYPAFKLNLMGLGVLHAIVGTVPEDYKWLASLVGMEGSIKQGTNELQNLINSCKGSEYEFALPEACVLKALLNVYLEKDYDSAEKAMAFAHQNYRSAYNPLMGFIHCTILLHTGRNEEALKLLRKRSEYPSLYPIPYMDYLEGLAMLNKLDPECRNYFTTYLEEFKGTSFIKASYQKLAWYALLTGNTGEYDKLMLNCKNQGQAIIDEDKQALNEATSHEKPNLFLLRARLFYDGGYYSKALTELTQHGMDQFPRLRDKIEFTYRLARIYQKMGQITEAIALYETTLKNGEKLSFHFAANSALELGYIYEKKDAVKAELFFKRCLKMRNHEYQNGIDQKAKAGLSRLSK